MLPCVLSVVLVGAVDGDEILEAPWRSPHARVAIAAIVPDGPLFVPVVALLYVVAG
jgi:hypothetical protein